ncbi:MAG TPA: M12 family metallo-peptidase, partial [Vicinamibacteria bacterium]|nr:M12 family metallo-peptidase [Vicinamibacteria bacterium]
ARLAMASRQGGATISLPRPDGSYARFAVQESPVMAPALARRYPRIKTYSGRGLDDPSATLRFSWTPLGLHALVLSAQGAAFVEPVRGAGLHVAYGLDAARTHGFRCLLRDDAAGRLPAGNAPSGDTLRTYRVAVATTGRYTAFFGSTADTIAGIVATLNGVNAIYNLDLAVHLVLIDDNEAIVFDEEDDPFDADNNADLNATIQQVIDDEIGDADYDVGHLFHKLAVDGDAGGDAGCIACVCMSGSKGSGFTSGFAPGDAEYIFVVAHEMGHQHGGTHTFNSCGGSDQRTGDSAYEPGSGTTIMSYASICGDDNVLSGTRIGDLYFHADSRQRITTYTGSGGGSGCG